MVALIDFLKTVKTSAPPSFGGALLGLTRPFLVPSLSGENLILSKKQTYTTVLLKSPLLAGRLPAWQLAYLLKKQTFALLPQKSLLLAGRLPARQLAYLLQKQTHTTVQPKSLLLASFLTALHLL